MKIAVSASSAIIRRNLRGFVVQGFRVLLILLAGGLSNAAQAQTTHVYKYDALGRLTSSSNATYGGGGSWMRYQFDSAGNRTNVRSSAFIAPTSRHELLANEQFVTGQALYSPNFAYELIAMYDGNLVLRTSSGILWCTGTATGQTLTVYMGGGGQLSLYNSDLNPLWQSGSSGSGASKLVVGNDGSLRIYDGATPIWTASGGCS